MRALATAVALALAALPALADDPAAEAFARANDAEVAQSAGLPEPAVNVAAAERAREEQAARNSNLWGLALDAGLPEGAAASISFRPVSKIRFWAGPAWNYISWGLQGGITAVAWRGPITPLISFEGGRYFKTNVSWLARNSEGVPEELKPLLAEMGCWYGAAHVGVEAGNPSGLSLSLRAGISYMDLSTNGDATFTDQVSGASVTLTDPSVRGAIPSVKLGIQYWF